MLHAGTPVRLEDWGVVVTVYAGGVVQWFHDRGDSASKVLELDAAVRRLEAYPVA